MNQQRYLNGNEIRRGEELAVLSHNSRAEENSMARDSAFHPLAQSEFGALLHNRWMHHGSDNGRQMCAL